MDRLRWSLQDAKNSFSTVVEAAIKRGPQTVTKRGKPAVVVVSVREYDLLCRRQAAEVASFTEHLLAMPQDDGVFEHGRAEPRDIGL